MASGQLNVFLGGPAGGSFDGATIYLSTATVSIDTDSAYHAVNCDTLLGTDPHGYEEGDGTLSIPAGKDGLFRITAGALIGFAGSPANEAATLAFYVQAGAEITAGHARVTASSYVSSPGPTDAMATLWATSTSPPIALVEGDVVELRVNAYIHAGTTTNGARYYGGQQYTFLSLERLGDTPA